MTPVKFEFFEPDGAPMANVTFEIRMAKSGFLEAVDGIVMPDTVLATTDAEGKVTVMLAPSSSLYYLKVINEDVTTDEECCVPGIFYKFYVPVSQTEVRVQDLIMDPPPSTTAWDEAAILIILEAKASSKASADAAKVSEDNAAASEAIVVEQAAIVADNTTITTQAALAAALSETNSKNSEDAARASELAAKASADFAGSAVVDMQDQVDEATAQAALSGQAKDIAVLAANSATSNAALTAADVVSTHADVVTSTTNKQATAADVVAVTTMKGEVSDFKDETQTYRDEALAAVGTITGVLVDGGLVDLSGGAYPPVPQASTIWRVTVGGTVTTANEGTITYGIGDSLVYTKAQGVWYKIDNSQAVTSVNSKSGAVVLTAADIDLGSVNNTSDMDKPVSNAQQAQFNLRTPTSTNLDKTAGRLTKVGDYGENGGPPIARIATDDANNLTVSATYAFTDGGVNVPEAAYIKHIGHSTAGYAKQIAYGILTDKEYVRTQNNGVWTSWFSSGEIIDALTSTDPTKALSAKQGKVLYDLLLANSAARYTKTESDARYYQQSQTYTQTQVADLLAASVGQGFIEGLQLVWVGAKDILIRAGSAYVPSIGKRVSFAGGNIVPTGVVDVNTFIHIYLNAAGTIFQSLNAPERYYNNGWRLTGDSSNRYLGSILINTNAIGAYKFRHDLIANKMWYTHAAPETSPFRLMNGLAGPAVGSMQTRPVTPVTAHTLIGSFRNNGSASINWTPSDAGTSVNTGWVLFNLANTMYSAEMPLSSIDGSITYSILTGAAGYCYATGYIFDR